MIVLDPRTTALVLIDLQNGILGRKLEPLSADQLIDAGKALAGRFRAEGAPVVAGQRVKPRLDGPARAVDEPSALPKTLPAGFADLAPGLAGPGDIEITKTTWGAFFRTDLDSELRRRGIRTIVLGGVATQFGVESTARQAWELGYELIIVRDATTSMAIEPHESDDAAYFSAHRPRHGRRRPRVRAGMTLETLNLGARPAALHWAALICATLAFVALFRLGGLPAALLLGAIAGAILVAWFDGRVHIPPESFILAQGVIGCLIAKAIGAASGATMLRQWPIFVIGIGTVMAFAAVLGVRSRPLEGAAGDNRDLGLLARRGDRDGADGRGFRRRHQAGRGDAISARGLRRARRLDRRPGMGRLGRRGARPDRLVSAPGSWAFARHAGDRRRRGGRRGEIQDPRRPVAGDARDRRRTCGDASGHDHPAALAPRRLICRGRLVDRLPVHPPDRRATRRANCRASSPRSRR